MAIYHLDISVISRSAGRSATAAAAYRLAVRIEDQRTGLVHDYTRRSGVVASGTVGWAPDAHAALWNKAEAAEKRANSRTAREVLIALPAELNTEQQTRLVRGFAAHLRDRYGIAASWAIHAAPKGGDERNTHAHILMTTRTVDASGTFGQKVRALDDQDQGPREILAIRAEWEKRVNRELEKSGSGSRISSQKQPIAPMEHLGPAATAKERRGIKTAAGSRNRRRADARERARAIVAEIQSLEREQTAEDQALAEQRRAQAAAVWRGVLDNTKTIDDRAKHLAAQLRYLEDRQGQHALLDDIKRAAPVHVRPDCWAVLRTIAERAQKIAAAAYHSLLAQVRRLADAEDRARPRQAQRQR